MTKQTSYTITGRQMTTVIVALNTQINHIEAQIRELVDIKRPTACQTQRLCYRNIELIEATDLRDMLRDGRTYATTIKIEDWKRIAEKFAARAQAEDDERCARAETAEAARFEANYR